MGLRNRIELAAAGIDDALQGLNSDPSGAALPIATGLRVPTFRPTTAAGIPIRYLFLLSTRVIDRPFRVRGIRTGYRIGATVATGPGGEGASGTELLELPVTTDGWFPPAGNVSWHLVLESNYRTVNASPATDNNSLCFQQALSPALLYETIGWSAPQTAFYWNNLNAYTPPSPADWRPLGGLGSWRDLRFPWVSPRAWDALDIAVDTDSARRVSLYASVLQTPGLTANTNVRGWPTTFTTNPPEQSFASLVNSLAGTPTVFITRVLGSLITEDCD